MTQHQCRMSKYCILGPVMESQRETDVKALSEVHL